MRYHYSGKLLGTAAEVLVGVLEQVGVMKRAGNKDRTSTETTMPARMGAGSWIILVVLLLLLVALHSDFDGLCRAFRLARAGVSNQRGPRCCETSLVAL